MVLAEVHSTLPRIVLTTDWSDKELAASLPGSKWNLDEIPEQWSIPLSWSSCLALRSTFRHKLEIGPALTEWATNELATRITPTMELREAVEYEGAADLYPFQRAGVEFIRRAKRCLIGDDPGSGKTVQAIRGAAALHGDGHNVFPILVVCPNSMKKTWAREFARWWPGVECSIVKGTAKKRMEALTKPAHVYIMNWEGLRIHSRLAPYGSIALKRCPACKGHDEKVTLRQCEVHERELNKINFKLVIADEAHRAKDPRSKQTRALWAATGDAPHRFALTGTPIANDVIDLWPILHWLAPHEWPSKTKWVDRFVNTMLNAFGGMMVLGIKPEMQEEFYKTIHPYFRRMPKSLVLPFLPPIIFETREVEMTPKQAKAYKEMKDKLMAELDDGTIMTTFGQLTQTARLSQLASAYLEPGPPEIVKDPETGEEYEKETYKLTEPSSKLDAFMDDLPDFGEESVAVVAVSKQLIMLLSERLKKRKIDHGLITGDQDEDERTQAIDDFQSGKTKLILFTAGAGGVGITLTAARYLVRLQRPWSRIDDVQVLNRVHRIGSEIHKSIIIIDYITEGTLEYRVRKALDEKGESFEEVVRDKDLLRRALLDEPEKKAGDDDGAAAA